MEAIPRLPMLSFELKTSPEYVDFGPVLKQYIRDQYGEDPAHYNKACSDLEQLRQNAVHVSHDFMGCSTLKKYYAQLQFLQGRFPMMEGGQATMPFTWDDIFMTREITLADIKFEQASVLYNIGSLHSILGAMETRHSADGMKVACTHFQCAAWAYEYLRDHFGSALMSNDFSHELLTFHVNLMLAQAQECILEKSMIDSRKSTITAKVAIQIVEFCNAATKALDVSHSDGIISSRRHKDWKKRIEIKVLLYQSISNFYMGKQSEEQQKWGECLAYFELSNKKLQECIKLSKSESSDIQESLRFANDVIGGKGSGASLLHRVVGGCTLNQSLSTSPFFKILTLTDLSRVQGPTTLCKRLRFQSAKKDNDFVYHDKVPDPSSLPEVKGASLVKGIPFNPSDPEISGPDLFQKLVPMEAHEASSLYSEEKAKLLRQVCGEIEDKDTQLSQFMSSLNLDESRLNFEPEKLPQELLEKCAAVSVKPNAIKNLIESMTAVSNLATEVEMSLREVSDFLENESTQEEEFQKQFGKRDINPMFETIRKELGLFEEGHRKGSQSNSDLHKAMNAHITNLRLLGGPIEDIKNALPSIEKERNTEDEGIAKEVKRLVSKVKEMQDQRSMLQEQFRKQIHEDDITNVLVTQEGANKQVMFDNELKKHEKTINLIQQNLGAQEKILNALTSTNARYATVRQSTDNVSERRDAMIKDLINSYEVYEDLLAKSQRGQEFYRKLEGNVKRLLARCQGLCKIQAEEREQILARFKPKVPVPSRPTAPKPQAPQAPRSPQPAGEPPENMSQTPPEQSYQSPVAPQFPTISSFDGPKLKDYLPFMKPKTFGKDRKTSSTTGSLPGSSAGSPVHLPAGSESLPGSPLQSLRRADTGDLDPSRLTGSLPGSPLHRRRMGDMGQYEISGPENYSFPDVTRQGMRSGGHRVGPRQEAYGGPITGNDFPSSGAAMLHSLPPQNHPTSVSGTSGESKAFVSQPQHFNPNISSQDNSPQIQPNLNLAYSGAGMGGYQPHPNMPPYSNSAGPTGHPEDSRTQAPSPALPLDSSQQQLKRPPQNMDPRQSGYNTEKLSHLTPKGHQDYSVSYHGDPISHSGPAIMSNIASVSQEQNSISTVSTVHAPMTSRVNSNTYSVLPQNIQQPSVQHKQPAPFPSQHSGISQTQLPSNLYQQQFSHTSQQLPSNPQQLSTNQYGMSNIPQQNPGSSQAQLPSNAQQLPVSSQQFPQSSQPFHYGSQFPNSSQNISSVHGSSSQTGQQYPQNSLDQQSTDQSGKCAVASHGPTYTTTTSYSGSTQTQGQYHQISQGQIPQQPVGQSQQPPQQSLPPRQPPQQSMPPQQLPQQSVPHQFPQQSLPGQQHPQQSLPGQQPHQQSLPGQQLHQQSLPPQQPINTGQQYTYGTPGGSQTGLPVSGQSQVYGISQQPGQMLPGQNWTAGQVGHQVSTSNIHQHPSQQLNSPAAQLQQQGQQVKGQMMTQQYISSQSNTNPASSAYSYVQSNTSQQQGLISATGQPSVSMTTGSGQLRQPAPQTFQQYPSQQPGMYGQQQWQQQPGLQQQLRFQTPQQQQVPSQQQQQQVPRHQQLQQQMQQPLPQQQKIPTQQHQLPQQQQQITPQQQQLPSQQQQLPSQQQQLPKNQQQWFQQQQQQLSYQQQQILQQQQMPPQQQLSQQQFQPQHQLSKQQQLQQQVPTSQQQVSQQKQQFPTHQSPQQQPLPTQQQQPLPTQQQPLPTQQQPLPKQQQPLPTQQQPLPTQQQPLPTQQQPLPTQQQSLPIQQQPLSTQQHTLPTQQQQSLPTKQHQPLPTQQQFASHVPQQNMQPMLPQSQQWTQPPQQAPPSQQWAKQPQQAPQPQQWAQQPPVSLQQQQWNRPTQYQEKLPLSPDSATQNLLPSPMTPTVAERPLSPLDKSQILPSDPIGQNVSELSSLTDLKPSPKHVKSDISNTSVTERKMHSRQHSTSSTTSFDDILSSSPGVPQESTKEGMLTPKVLTAQEIQQQKEEAMLKSSFTRQSSKDPYSDPLVKDRFVGEVEKFAKCVESLTKITCSGFSNLDLYWKELIEEQEKGGKKTSMAIARCYPAKNRDQDIMPYDNTRVKLVSSKDDYINASWITELSPSCPKFISTQLPLTGTIVDFWTMVYEQGSEVIVMLTSDTETGKKYPEYWPNQKGQMEEYGAISLILQSVKDKTNWTERIFHLNHREKKQGRTIVQLQYKNWPISGFPENISYLLQFINEVHSFYRQQRSLLKPVIIHCSNGIGRTGVFMLTYTGMQEIDHGNGIINIPEVAKKMFQQRRFAVKEKGQLKYVYDAILYYSQDILAKQGILVRKASFGDPLPHPGERSNQWTPKEDVLFGTQLSISALQARLGQNEPQIIMKSGGSESDISVSDKEIDSRNSVERTLSENLPDVVQRTDLQQNKVKEDSVGSSQQEEITDKNRTETSSSGVLIEDIPTSNIIEKEITKQDGSLQFTTDNSTVCEQTPPVSTTKMSLSDLQNPQTFTLGTCDKSKKKITKDSFHQQNLTLTENLNDPADPLSTLDPLWSINK